MKAFTFRLVCLFPGLWAVQGFVGAAETAPQRITPDQIVAGIDPAVLKTVCARPIGFNVTVDLVDFFNEWAGERDFAKMAARDPDSILKIKRGRIIAQLGQPGQPQGAQAERPRRQPPPGAEGAAKAEPARPERERAADRPSRERPRREPGAAPPAASGPIEPLPKSISDKIEFVSLSEKAAPEDLTQLASEYRKQGKKITTAPTGEMLLQDSPEQLASRARNADLFIIQAERWIYEDKSEGFGECIPRIHGLIESLKKANPKCLIGIEIGRRADRGGGTARLFFQFFARYETVHPGEIDMNYLFITRQTAADPNMGYDALRDYFAIARPKAKSE